MQLDAAAELVADIMRRYNIPGNFVVSHASVAIPAGRKIDPVNFDWADFWNRIIKYQNTTPENVPVSTPYVYTANSATLNIPIVDEQKMITHISTRFPTFGEYKQNEIAGIVSDYIKYGKQTGIDWVFAIAQCVHETGWFKSWWAARPRRNPAGIGVTGQTRTTDPKDDINWFYDNGIWKRGQRFKSWNIAIQHHYGRLLCYALKEDEMTPSQQEFSNIIIAKERLNAIRGCAPTLVGLNGVWAVPGKTYAQKLASIANSFIAASQ